MLHRAIESIVLVPIIIILIIIMTPIVNTLFYDVLPTNSNFTLDEFLELTVPEDCEFEYIQKDNYLDILVFDERGLLDQNIYAYKGKNSGYTQIFFVYGYGNRIKMRYEYIVGDELSYVYTYTLVKHRGKYIIKVSFNKSNLLLYDNEGNRIENTNHGKVTEFFEVFDSIPKDYEVYAKLDGEDLLLIDYKMIKEKLG